jgi:hypothetical protein
VKTAPHCEHLAFLPACFSSALNRFPQAEHSATIAIGANSRPAQDVVGVPQLAQLAAGIVRRGPGAGKIKPNFATPVLSNWA